MLAGRLVSPGTVAWATMTAGTPARTAAANGSRPPACRLRHGSVAAGLRSVLPVAPPRPGKCLTTGTMPAVWSPAANARPAAEAVFSIGLNDRVPSGLVALGPGPPSRSSTGARSIVTPAAFIRRPSRSARRWISVGVIVAASWRADGTLPTRLAIRWTAPPSSSVMTNGGMPPGASRTRRASDDARSAGARAPNRGPPPAPGATSPATDPTSPSSTGITTVCSASRRTLQVLASTPRVVQATDPVVGRPVVDVTEPVEGRPAGVDDGVAGWAPGGGPAPQPAPRTATATTATSSTARHDPDDITAVPFAPIEWRPPYPVDNTQDHGHPLTPAGRRALHSRSCRLPTPPTRPTRAAPLRGAICPRCPTSPAGRPASAGSPTSTASRASRPPPGSRHPGELELVGRPARRGGRLRLRRDLLGVPPEPRRHPGPVLLRPANQQAVLRRRHQLTPQPVSW